MIRSILTAALVLAIFPQRARASDVAVVSTDSLLRLPHGSGSVRMIYRNISEYAWHNTKLSVESTEPLNIQVKPQRIPRCQPADRCVFVITAQKTTDTPKKQFPIMIKLTSDKRPNLHAMKFQADSTPGADKTDKGWMHAGTITISKQSRFTKLLVLTLLSAIPVILLLGLGIYLKKRTRKNEEYKS